MPGESASAGRQFRVTVGVSDPSEWELVVFVDDPRPARAEATAEVSTGPGAPDPQPVAPESPPLPSWCRGTGTATARPAAPSELVAPAVCSRQIGVSSGSSDRRPASSQTPHEGFYDILSRPQTALEDDRAAAAHGADTCRPCFFEYHGVCDKGGDCRHCHLPHTARQLRRANPSQGKRNNVRRRLEARGGTSPPMPLDPASDLEEEDEDG